MSIRRKSAGEAGTSSSTRPLRIMIVEDDQDARENLRDILELDGHVIQEQSSASMALDDSRELMGFDVILIDRKLPDGLAEDLLPRFRKRAPHADMIVVTGFADLTSTIAALREGVADYIIKPINPVALLDSLRRISKRRDTERKLSEEREFAQRILQTAEAIILVLDTQGRIVQFNPYLTELTGYALDEVRNRDWLDTFVPPKERQRVREIFRRTVQQRQTRGVISPILTKSGDECEIRWSNTIVNHQEGYAQAVLAVGLDVTDLVRAQAKLLQTERLAAIGQTMAGLAHESRNALQRLQNALELLEDEFEEQPAILRDLNKIGRASRDLRDLLDEVRSYAAPIILDRNLTTLPAVWRRAWGRLDAPRYQHRQATLNEYPCAAGVQIKIDARRFEQVFRNLFENALDACPDPVVIDVSCQCTGGGVQLTIRDNGPGMPQETRENAFDAFFTTKPKGTGLGLAIVRRIVESHQGTINISDTLRGTEFVIYLPND